MHEPRAMHESVAKYRARVSLVVGLYGLANSWIKVRHKAASIWIRFNSSFLVACAPQLFEVRTRGGESRDLSLRLSFHNVSGQKLSVEESAPRWRVSVDASGMELSDEERAVVDTFVWNVHSRPHLGLRIRSKILRADVGKVRLHEQSSKIGLLPELNLEARRALPQGPPSPPVPPLCHVAVHRSWESEGPADDIQSLGLKLSQRGLIGLANLSLVGLQRRPGLGEVFRLPDSHGTIVQLTDKRIDTPVPGIGSYLAGCAVEHLDEVSDESLELRSSGFVTSKRK
ncbi:MAG: hypothetical protein AAGA37_13720 [Actinomycetota bacterium]